MPQPEAAVPPLPLSGIAPSSLATLFQDPTIDPTMGNYASLLLPFEHNLGNAANNASTEVIKNGVVQSGAQHRLIAATIVISGCSRSYLCPFHWDNDLVATNPNLDGKFFALEGDIFDNNGYLV